MINKRRTVAYFADQHPNIFPAASEPITEPQLLPIHDGSSCDKRGCLVSRHASDLRYERLSTQAPRSCRHPKEVRVDKRSARQSGEDGCAPVHHTSLCHFLVECLHWSESAPFALAVASRRRTLQLDIINRERLVCRPGHLRIASKLVSF